MTREQQILRSILAQKGVTVPCFRCGVTLSVEDAVQKEHLHERALGGPDVWGNWRWSHKVCHAKITDGTKATSAGSSKHRIAKAKRIAKTWRSDVEELAGALMPGEPKFFLIGGATAKPKRKWPKGRKLKSRPFEKGHRPMRRRVA